MVVFLGACAAVASFAAWQRPGLPWRPARAGFVLARYAGFAVVWLAATVGYLWLMARLGQPVPMQAALRYLADGDRGSARYWVVAAGIVLGAPVAEEIVFRGYLQQALLGVLRPAWAIGVTAAVFGAAHTLPNALPIAMLGGFFGWLAHRTGALWPAVLAHAVHNAVTVAIAAAWPESLDLLFPK
jgi:membrane protease YdiL (CAAX protease family)